MPSHVVVPLAFGPLADAIWVLGFLAAAARITLRFGPTLTRLTGWCSWWVAWACGSQGGYGYCVAFMLAVHPLYRRPRARCRRGMDISSQAPPREGVGAGGQVARDGLKTRVRARARGARRAGLASRSGAPSLSAAPAHPASPQLNAFRERTARRGVNPFVYWPVRALLVPALLIYFRTRRIGREHLPRSGPLLFASNHRS